jgi:WD40 repeat protein
VVLLGSEMLAEQHAAREIQQRIRAEEAFARLEMKRVEDALAANDVVQGLTPLARVLRANPSNIVAAQRLVAALTHRSFPLPVFEPLRHDDYVWSAEYSPDGRWLATASRDGTARVWDARSGQPVTPPLRHLGGVVSARFNVEGNQLITCSHDKTARIWDAQTGQPITSSLSHSSKVNSAVFSADGKWAVTAR